MLKFKATLAGFAVAVSIGVFASATTASAQSCGNNNVQEEAGEVCDNGGANNTQDVGCCAAGCESFVTGGTVCRPALGTICDTVPETCTGTSAACPADIVSSSTTLCRPSLAGVCDSAENCTGTSNTCPPDTFASSSVICRGSAGVCDPAENCTGSSGACPPDSVSPDNTVCRPDSGVCDDGPEFCDGTNDACPPSEAVNQGVLCRASGGFCDPQEVCDGTSSDCPPDAKSTSVCRVAAGECDIAESCDGTNNACPANAKSTEVCRPAVHEDCDVAESCDGTSNDCPEDELTPSCEDEGDDLECTEATCVDMGAFGECVIADNCVEICRSPGFWQTHSGEEKNGENIGQAVLDELIDGGEPLEVCGQVITETTDLGDLDSALEGLCMKAQGVKQRQLYRILLTTGFNCAISEGSDCDDVLEGIVDVKFSECSALCADDPVPDGPTLNECKSQLSCFNKGGKWIDGGCALGTCSVDTEELCGADYGDCPDEQDCERFPDSCKTQDLCSEDLVDAPAQICPKPGPASSPKICNVARHNDCTIDQCFD